MCLLCVEKEMKHALDYICGFSALLNTQQQRDGELYDGRSSESVVAQKIK